jgi:ACS family glucarate transporter-like MFS transporter
MNPIRGRVRWALIVWMFVISAVAYLDRVNISIAGSAIQKDYGLDNVRLGWVFSAFVLGYALFQVPGGLLADKFGPRRILALGTVWWGVFTALSALVPTGFAAALTVLLAVRFALGIGEAVVYPASNRLVAAWMPSQERGVANGIIFAGVGAGAGVTPPLIRWILENYGWRVSFLVSAAIGLAAGLVWYLIARDRPSEHPWVDEAEAAHIRAGLPAQMESKRVATPWAAMLSSKDVWAISLSYFCYGYVAYIFFTWFFIYLNKVRGLDLKSSSYYGMLPFIAMAVGSPLGGVIGDSLTRRYGKRVGRCGVAAAGLGLAAVFIAMGTQAADARLATVVLAGGAGALYLSASSFWSVTADLGGSSAGAVSGFMNMCNQSAGALTASVTPLIAAHFGWTASFLTAAGLCAVGSLAWLVVDPGRELGGGRSKA